LPQLSLLLSSHIHPKIPRPKYIQYSYDGAAGLKGYRGGTHGSFGLFVSFFFLNKNVAHGRNVGGRFGVRRFD
jgi:hypothetical protein